MSYDWSYWYPDRPDLGSPYDPPVYSLVEIAPPVPAEPILVHETVTAEYRYNYQGLRTKKTVTRVNDYLGTSVEETFFIYDLSGNLIEERFGPNEADWIRRYVWGPGGRLAMVENRDGSYDVARTNLRGDVVSWVTASTGAPETDRFEYDPWGNILSGPRFAPPIRYASYYYDEESGLYYVKARYYSPELGRFLTKDPAAPAATYLYAANGPLRFVDRSGQIATDAVEDDALTQQLSREEILTVSCLAVGATATIIAAVLCAPVAVFALIITLTAASIAVGNEALAIAELAHGQISGFQFGIRTMQNLGVTMGGIGVRYLMNLPK